MERYGYIRNDDDGHNYLVPEDKLEQFENLYEALYANYSDPEAQFEAEDAFNDFAGPFRIDGIEDLKVVLPD